MSKTIFAIMLVTSIGLLHYCKSHSKETQNIAQEPQHSSQQSLDWDGIYRGVLPCADCQGTQTTIYLNKNLSYRLKIKYLGRSDSVYDQSGVFSWNKQGNTITLHNQPKPNSFFVGEGTLTKLDMDGNKITGSLAAKYILSKQHYAILEKYWKLTELYGKPVTMDSTLRKEPHLILKEVDNRYNGNGSCNNFSGTYVIEGMNRISLGNAAVTRMACPRIDIESRFLEALQSADNYNITGDMLALNKAKMAPLARFKTVYMK